MAGLGRSPQEMEFDIYYPGDSIEFQNLLHVGTIVELDGIDGFFDQYFEARSQGDVIHFIPSFPTDPTTFDTLPLIEASISSSNSISGTVEIRSITPFKAWMMGLPDDSVTHTDPYGEVESLLPLIPEYRANAQFYWQRPHEEKRRRRSPLVNALLGIPTPKGFRLAALTSNELSSVILSREPAGEQGAAEQPATAGESK